MSRYAHLPSFSEFFGMDIRSSEKTRERGYSGDGALNVMHTAQGGIGARPGTKNIGASRGHLGLAAFKQTDILGQNVERVLGFGGSSVANSGVPYRLVEATFTLTNSHATLPATVSMRYSTAVSQFVFTITRGGSLLLNQSIGTGTAGTTLATLETTVDLLTSFSMSTPTTPSTPACFMQMMNEEVVAAAGGTLTVTYWYWSQVNFSQYSAAIVGTKHHAYEVGLDSFRPVSTALLRNVLYVAWGNNNPGTINGNTADKYGQIWKYDGQEYYPIGAPFTYGTADAGGSAVPASATDVYGTFSRTVALPANVYKYRYRHVVVDKAGNRIEGDLSEEISVTGDGVHYVRLKLYGAAGNPIYSGKQGWARTNGAGSGLTRNVDAGHTLVAGDIGFYYDSGQGRFIQREIASTTATSVTFSATAIDIDPDSDNYDNGATPTVLDNAIISSNVRAEIWRTKAGGTAFYFLNEVPLARVENGAESIESHYYDEEDDDNELTDALVERVYPQSWRSDQNAWKISVANSPACRFLCAFNDQLIAAGDDRRPCTVYFSEAGEESFPRGTHEFDLPAPVTAIQQCGEVLMVWTEKTTHVVSGDLLNFNFRVDIVAEVGCTSHASIQKLEEGVVVWQSEKGPYISFGGRRVEPLGPKKYKDGSMVSRIEPFFTQKYATTATQPAFKRSTSAHLPKDRLYLLFVPFEDPSKPGFATTSSVIWAFDYGRGIWWKWSGFGCAGGMAVVGDVLYSTTRTHDGAAGTTFSNASSRTNQQQRALARTNSADSGLYNHADHNEAMTWRFKAHWETLGRTSQFKRFLRNKIDSHETRAASSTAMTVYAYFDWDETKYWSDTITWTTEKSLRLKLRAETCQAMMVAFEQTAVFHAPPVITGYELEAVANFRPEMKE